MALDSDAKQDFKVVGTRPPRPDGVEKVTGRAMYGADATAPGMLVGRILRQDFLQQNGFDPVDATCSLEKAYGLLQMMLKLHQKAREALETGATVEDLLGDPVIEKINRARYVAEDEFVTYRDEVLGQLDESFKVPA